MLKYPGYPSFLMLDTETKTSSLKENSRAKGRGDS